MRTGILEENFQLIKSLTKSEKRYFKLYTGFQQGDKTYLKLFDIIDRQTVFDERRMTQQFLKISTATNFPSIKKYLFEQLIGSLKSYGAYKDLDSDHTDLIETYKVLHYKGLYGLSDSLLKKIKQLTLEDDAYTRHFSVLLMEYHREFFNPETAKPENVIRILNERRNILNIMDNYLSVGHTFTLLRLHLRKKLYCRNKEDRDTLTKIVQPVLKTTEADMLSRTALGMRNVTLCDYYIAIGKPKKAFETSKIFLELRKSAGSNDKLDLQTLNEYMQHLTISIRSGYFIDFEQNARSYKELLDTVKNKEKYFIAYEKWYNYMLMYFNRTGQFHLAAEFIKTEERKTGEPGKQFSMKSKLTCWYFLAYNLYGRKEHKKSLQYIQRIINHADTDVDEYSYAKLLMMFIHYDLGNFELLEYQVRSTQRLMQKTQHLYQCEKVLLAFFKNVSEADNKTERQNQLLELEKKTTVLFKSPYESGFAYYFDILAWIKSKVTSKDFSEVFAGQQ